MTLCFNCNAVVAPQDRFCGNCGMTVHPAASPASAAIAATMTDDETSASLAVEDDHSAGGVPGDRATPVERDASDSAHREPSGGEVEPAGAAVGADPELQATLIESARNSPHLESTPHDAQAAPVADPVEKADSVSSRPDPLVEAHGEPRTQNSPSTSSVSSSRAASSRIGNTGGRRPQTQQLEPGTLLNLRYEIVRRIGGGGMGAVYYAKDKNLGDAPRAVKEMIQSNIDESQHEKAIGDFKRESMLLAQLEHHSIPTIYDYFYDEPAGRFYLVMRYIAGGDFLARLRNAPGGRIDEQTVTDWATQVADVLHYLHSQRPAIIYRDLKPANLMIDGNSGRVMLIDFGIARWVQKEEKGVTAVGTMGYAPPELFSGKVEPRSDLYSLGATMFHLLTGSDPQDNPLLIFDFTKNPRPRQINPALSNEMERILMRAVEYKPDGRFRSAEEMRDTLAQHREKIRAGAVTYGTATANERQEKTTAMEMVYCGFCGGRITADDVFCAHCGAKQPLAIASAALRAARATAKLVVMGTTELDAAFQLQKDTHLVGRSDPHSNIFPEIDLSKFDPETKISRRHARIWREGDTFLVEDLGSVNGTVVNESIRLGARQPRVLENGDKLRLGETTLHFLVG